MPPMPPAKNHRRQVKAGWIIVGVIVLVLFVRMALNVGETAGTATSSAPVTTTAATSAPVGPQVDQSGQFACDDFGTGYPAAATAQARVDLANKVNRWASQSKSGRIAEMGQMLGRGADGSPQTWQISADAFAKACFDAGWRR